MRDEIPCPSCSEYIKAEAVYCKHCQRRVQPRPYLLPVILIAVAAVVAFLSVKVFDRPSETASKKPAVEESTARTEPKPAGERKTAVFKKSTKEARVSEATDAIEPPSMDFEEAQKALVRIETIQGTGSGFFVSESGKALTSAHVVGKNKKAVVHMRDGTSAEAKILLRNEDGDMAVLQIEADRKFPFLELEDSTTLKTAQQVTVVGFPLGLETAVVTRGIVSAAPLYLPGLATPLIQIDASVNPGNSGGPVLNSSNRVVGIVAAKLFGAESMNWVMPINYAHRLQVKDARKLDSKLFREWKSRGREKAQEDGTDELRSPEQVFSSWGSAESINIEWVATLRDSIQVFVTLLDDEGEPMATQTNIGVAVRWEGGSCLGMKDVDPNDFSEQTLELARENGYKGEAETLVNVRVPCRKLPSGSRVTISADFGESEIADYYTIQLN